MNRHELRDRFEGDLDQTDAVRKRYSTDWSLFAVPPELVAYPKHVRDIQTLVQFVREQREAGVNTSLTVRAAGTDMTGGPLNQGVILDTTRYLYGVRSVQRIAEMITQTSFFGHTYTIAGRAVVLPGTFYRDFETQTLAKNLILPCYPASKDLCAIGGMVANNGAGEKSLKYGQNKDFVEKLKVVFADGNEYTVEPLSYTQLRDKMAQEDFEGQVYQKVYELIKQNWDHIQTHKPKTSKNSSGYYLWDVVQAPSIAAFESGTGQFDLTKLIVGAQGTTGVITEVTYKLVAHEPVSDLLVMYVDSFTQLPALVEKLMKFDVEMLEMYDDHTFRIGLRFFRDFLKNKGLFGSIRYLLRFLPEVWHVVRFGIPKLIVLAEFVSNNPSEVRQEVRAAHQIVRTLGVRSRVITRDVEEEKFWDFRHDSFKILTEHSTEARAGGGMRTAPFIDDIAVNPEHLDTYLPKLIAILNRYNIVYTVAGHLGNGNFHIIPLMDTQHPEARMQIAHLTDEVYKLALSYDATLSAEHNDGIIRTPYLVDQFGQIMVNLFSAVKDIFDPLHIFNPGKKVGGTKEDIDRWMQ